MQEFDVHILAAANLAGVWKNGQQADFLLGLSLDGRCVGYTKGIQAGGKAVFDGWLTSRETVKASEDQPTDSKAVYNNFRFASTLVQPSLICKRCVLRVGKI